MKHKKSIPIDAIMSAVVILLVLALAVDGFFSLYALILLIHFSFLFSI